jgi:hypothetical protein
MARPGMNLQRPLLLAFGACPENILIRPYLLLAFFLFLGIADAAVKEGLNVRNYFFST